LPPSVASLAPHRPLYHRLVRSLYSTRALLRTCRRPIVLRGPALDFLIARLSLDRRGMLRAVTIALSLAACAAVAHAATRVLLHASLLRSTPAANSHLTKAPESIRLVFSEQIVPELSQIALVRPDGSSTQLRVSNDPHDVHALVGSVAAPLTSGSYKVSWRVVSADGHPVGGSFSFTIEGARDTSRSGVIAPLPVTATTPVRDSAHGGAVGALPVAAPEEKQIPVLAALFRGLGLGGMMTGLGVLFFVVTSRVRRDLAAPKVIVRAITIGAILLVAHMIAWLDHVSPTGRLSADFLASMLGSTIGRVELLRTILALLTLSAIALARRTTPALILGGACLLVSGAIGHPAAIDPYWTIPAKMLHLLAGSVWIGGLVWLVWLSRCDEPACRIEARRVSSFALIAVIVIALSGLLETFFFLNTPADLTGSPYGRRVLAKMIGLAILVGLGAYNRFGLLPTLDATDGPRKLSLSVRVEVAVLTVIIVIGGFLAYEPTPTFPQSAASAAIGISK
jgi:copper transport protein